MSENSRNRNYYGDLGLTPSATATQIKAAYHRLALLHHPDKQGPGSEGDASKFRNAQEAYEKLYEAKVREEKSKATYKTTTATDTDTDTDIRPFNVFNPRPRRSPPAPAPTQDVPHPRAPPNASAPAPNTPRPTTKRTYTYNPNAKFHDVGSEFEEH
ncbi:DnaJ-domain-containing protein [Karstenula rhodostoma CBS 690.94]|uniref:DnaJ-domain-containing protein n=1 Tax=Karstenula rhodostoma CBS 690.94 TaxID=1392251 RepID=A0A9P4UCT9_9PLEO|nr:DnaJ-domain-containing protein [Karstenula rhodostoma CBS 690.94]